MNDDGEVDSISIPIEEEVENITFIRKQPALSQDIIAALVGEYDLPMEGISLTITAHEGKIYAAQTENPPQEIQPYKLEDSLVVFKMKRSRLELVRENNVIKHLVLKTPFMTLEAPRKESTY